MNSLGRYRDLHDWHDFKMLYIKRNPDSGTFQSWQDQNNILLLTSGQSKYCLKLEKNYEETRPNIEKERAQIALKKR